MPRVVRIILKHKRIDNIGLFAKACDDLVIVGNIQSESFYRQVSELAPEVIRVDIMGSPAIVFSVVLNSNGIVVPSFMSNSQIDLLKKTGKNVHVCSSGSAVGNLIAVNDKGGIASKRLPKKELYAMGDALGIELVDFDLGKYTTPGSLAVATNKGVCVSPSIKNMHADFEEILKVNGDIVTCNMGSPYLHIGIIANSKGAYVGHSTSGFELGQIESSLGFI